MARPFWSGIPSRDMAGAQTSACTATWTMHGWQLSRVTWTACKRPLPAPLYLGWGTDLWAPSQKLIENVAVLNQRLAPTAFSPGDPRRVFPCGGGDDGDSGTVRRDHRLPGQSDDLAGPLWPPAMAATDTLLNAEKFAAINYALGYAPYPGAEFDSHVEGRAEIDGPQQRRPGRRSRRRTQARLCAGVSLRAGQILRDSLRNIAERVQHPFPGAPPSWFSTRSVGRGTTWLKRT